MTLGTRLVPAVAQIPGVTGKWELWLVKSHHKQITVYYPHHRFLKNPQAAFLTRKIQTDKFPYSSHHKFKSPKSQQQTHSYVPDTVPRLELSKNCLGHWTDKGSTPVRESKNLLLGESMNALLGEFSSLFISGCCRLIGVRGDWGASFLLSCLNLQALFFHLVISSCCLVTRLENRKSIYSGGTQSWTTSSTYGCTNPGKNYGVTT